MTANANSGIAAARSGAARWAAGRAVAAVELAAFAASILAFIWWLEPLGNSGITAAFYVYIFAFAVGSNLLHGDALRSVGIRIDTLARSARDVALPTAVAVALFALVGWIAGSLRWPEGASIATGVAGYTAWALVQQYALNGFVLQRLLDAGLRRRAPLAAAALFALMHLPNPGLMALTFAGGLVWCRSFMGAPNLLPPAVSHACAALAADRSLPAWFVAGLRIGPGYHQP